MKTDIPFLQSIRRDRFFLLAGPCVIENEEMPFQIAEKLVALTSKYEIPFVFKGSYKKPTAHAWIPFRELVI